MKKFLRFYGLLFVSAVLIYSCEPSKITTLSDDDKIEIVILQTNDVYEIAPLEGGKVGGMSRVAQLKKELLEENPNTISVLAGDFLNPSVIGTLKYEGKKIEGKQMVEVMNSAGIDLVTFGNHEFDLKEPNLNERISESEFDWTVANVFNKKNGQLVPFQHKGKDIPAYWIKEFKDQDGTSIKVGFISVCINSNPKKYVHYDDAILKFEQTHAAIKNKVDFVIGLTHLAITEDKKLAAQLDGVPLIMGGHEHTNMKHKVGNVIITKADANAKTAYIHVLKYNKKTKKIRLVSDLTYIDETIAKEPKTEKVVQKWVEIANKALKANGINPDEVVVELKKPINATEDVIRHRPSVIGKIIAGAVGQSYPEADGAFINTGSIRIDDIISGKITQYDIVRILPFGGADNLINMKGSDLLKTLDIGFVKNLGKGGYIATYNMTYDAKTKKGTVKGQPIEEDKTYKVALPSFLLTGLEENFDYLKDFEKSIVKKPSTEAQKDVRIAVIEFLKKNPIPTVD
jgi:2',3'-cyclic-nucleotide 2'-phosphodiesterase (5'-nucleotidase family)